MQWKYNVFTCIYNLFQGLPYVEPGFATIERCAALTYVL